MVIRDYDRNDAFAITRLFYETVHSVNSKDYSEEQVRAWAPEIPDPDIWHSRMIQRCTLVAEESGQVIAFAELECDGHLDMFYCRRDVIGHGVGRQLYRLSRLGPWTWVSGAFLRRPVSPRGLSSIAAASSLSNIELSSDEAFR
jgi:hypothetical protein